MNLKEALEELVYQSRNTKIGLSRKAGYENPASFNSMCRIGDAHLSTLDRMARAAGYRVALISADPSGSKNPIVIDIEKNEKRNQD